MWYSAVKSAGERFLFGGTDYLTRYPAGHHYDLRIESPLEKPGWKGRRFSTIGQSMFPGTAIEFEGLYYEVVLQDFEPGPPQVVTYYLKRWEDSHTIRTQFHYNEMECQKLLQSHRQEKQTHIVTLMLESLVPFIGMLPAEDQIKIGNRYGLPPTRMTSISAAVMLVPSVTGMLLFIAHFFGLGDLPGPQWLQILYPFGMYFFTECLLRLMTAMKLEEPIGSLLVALPLLVFRGIRRSFDPAYKQRELEARHSRSENHQPILLNARDEILKVESTDHDLEVISVLPKDHWNARLGIGYNGDWYGLVGSERIRQRKNIRYKYFLKKAEEGTWFSNVREYDPEEVQVLYREKRRTDLKTWVDTFAVAWGMLAKEDQIALEEIYEFDALKFTKMTAVLVGFFGFVNLIICIINFVTHIASAADGWIFLPALYFVVESYSRWQEARKGEPAGSVLGVLVRPFATKLLAGP
jgi:hypothetical protein